MSRWACRTSPATTPRAPVDTVITGALILDHWGVVKADVGLRDGRIQAIGKAYNPETMDAAVPTTTRAPRTSSSGPRPR